MEIERLKLKVKDSVELQRQQLIELSLKIHDNPELGFKEEKASAWLTDYLEGNEFVTPFCCYGNDVDCDLCGAWLVFYLAAQLEEGYLLGFPPLQRPRA